MVEGSWDEVMRVIGQAHTLVHQGGVLRVQTDIRAGTRWVFTSLLQFPSCFTGPYTCSS